MVALSSFLFPNLHAEVLSVLRSGGRHRGGGGGSSVGRAGLERGLDLLELSAVEVALVRHLAEPLVQVAHLIGKGEEEEEAELFTGGREVTRR